MGLDEKLCKLPLIGFLARRFFSFFRKNIFFADTLHFIFGLGIGLIIADYLFWGYLLLALALIGHIYAFIKGSKEL